MIHWTEKDVTRAFEEALGNAEAKPRGMIAGIADKIKEFANRNIGMKPK